MKLYTVTSSSYSGCIGWTINETGLVFKNREDAEKYIRDKSSSSFSRFEVAELNI